MPKYRAEIRQTNVTVLLIEADSLEEAERLLDDEYNDFDILDEWSDGAVVDSIKEVENA